MKDKIKIILLINLFFLTLPIKLYPNELIIPPKKPSITSDVMEKSIVSNFLIPLKKPIIVKNNNIITKEISKENKINKINGIVTCAMYYLVTSVLYS